MGRYTRTKTSWSHKAACLTMYGMATPQSGHCMTQQRLSSSSMHISRLISRLANSFFLLLRSLILQGRPAEAFLHCSAQTCRITAMRRPTGSPPWMQWQ